MSTVERVINMTKEKKSWGARIFYLFANRFMVNSNTRMLYAFVPVFLIGMGLSEGQYFNALTIAGIFALFTPMIIPMAETRGRRFAMGIALVLFAIGNFLVILIPTFLMIAAGLGISTLGFTLFQATAQAYVGDETPFEKRGRYVSFLELSWSISYFVGMPLLSILISNASEGNGLWRLPFLILGVASVISLLLLKKIIPYTPAPQNVKEGGEGGLNLIIKALKSPYVLVALLYGFFIQAAAEYMNLTYSLWLDSAWGLQIALLGLVAAVFGIGEFTGEFSVVQLSDKIGKKTMCGIGNLLGAITAILAPFVFNLNPWVSVIILALFYVGFEISICSGFSVMTQVVPGLRAAFMGIFAAVLQLGRVVADFTCSNILTAGANNGFSWVSWVAGGCFLAAFIFLTFIKVQPEEDVQNA